MKQDPVEQLCLVVTLLAIVIMIAFALAGLFNPDWGTRR
jgi:hypothetical protein